MVDATVSEVRRALLGCAVVGICAPRAGLANDVNTGLSAYGRCLRAALGLNVPRATAEVILGVLAAEAGLKAKVVEKMAWLRSSIGDQWHTASHTVPQLVEVDLRTGNHVVAGGWLLTHTELALLVA